MPLADEDRAQKKRQEYSRLFVNHIVAGHAMSRRCGAIFVIDPLRVCNVKQSQSNSGATINPDGKATLVWKLRKDRANRIRNAGMEEAGRPIWKAKLPGVAATEFQKRKKFVEKGAEIYAKM